MPHGPVDRLRFPSALRAQVVSLARSALPDETGGVLLGFVRGRDASVAHVIGPGPSAKRGSTWFDPDHGWQLEQIGRRFAKDPGSSEYLGDWHTHPDGPAVLSSQDRAVGRLIARHAPAANPRPLLVVLSVPRRGGVDLAAFQWGRWWMRQVTISE